MHDLKTDLGLGVRLADSIDKTFHFNADNTGETLYTSHIVVNEIDSYAICEDISLEIPDNPFAHVGPHGFAALFRFPQCGVPESRGHRVGPEDLDVIECHDATAPSEVVTYEGLSLCGDGEGGELVEKGVTRLGGRCPVNTSGGLLRKGHPVGATGIAQIVELTEQLQGRSGQRQVEGAKVALAHNGGGTIGPDAAAMCVTILTA